MNKISSATNDRNKRIIIMKLLILEIDLNYGILKTRVFREIRIQNGWDI